MASSEGFMEFVAEQCEDAGRISFRKMFGEYALYCDGKVVALVCDDRLYVKPTEAGRAYAGDAEEAPPYPGAKPYLLVDDRFEDRDWLTELIRLTAEALPEPRPKRRRGRESPGGGGKNP